MMEKRINASIEGVVKQGANGEATEVKTSHVPPAPPNDEFPLGTKFVSGPKIWTVVKAWRDTATDMRHVQATTGDEEVLTLHTLRKDMEVGVKAGSFAFVELTEHEKLIARARLR